MGCFRNRGSWIAVLALVVATVVGAPVGQDRDRAFAAAAAGTGPGYRLVGSDGGVFTFGDRSFAGSLGGVKLSKPVVAGASTALVDGYVLASSDGGVFTFGVPFAGPLVEQGAPMSSARWTDLWPVTAIELSPVDGYWLVYTNGVSSGVWGFGNAYPHDDAYAAPDAMYNLAVALRGREALVAMASTPTGHGYWLAGSKGGVFAFGDAGFYGSMGDRRLSAPIVDIAAAPDGKGYYLVGRDGGVFTFGSARFAGSTGAMKLNAPVVGLLPATNGVGYWLAAADGGVFSFGGAPFLGSMAGAKLAGPIVAIMD